jgi:hypothetical protein
MIQRSNLAKLLLGGTIPPEFPAQRRHPEPDARREKTHRTMPPSSDLSSFQKTIHSQFGEDGIIEEALRRISLSSPLDAWCVEFGALDGVSLSNTCHLIKDKGYKAVLIEGDRAKFKVLCGNLPQPEVIKVCRFVTLDGASTLDAILQETPIPADFDFLSIDIDGCDYHIFESLKVYRPKIVCIEFNPTVPNEIEFVQPADFAIKHGSGAKSIVRLAAEKGYALIAVTYCNLIFVRNDFRVAVTGSEIPTLESLRDDSEYRAFIFFGYDGSVLSNKNAISMPWHRLELDSRHLQQLPKYLRRFGEDYSVPQKLAFASFVLLRFPRSFPRIFQEKIWKKMFKPG